jgi:gluconolactonase
VFDVQPDGGLKNGRLFYQMEKEGSGPDGMKVDIEGNVYCRGPGGIHVTDPKGKLLGVIKVNDFSNMAWGDADWKTLYVTGHSVLYRMRLNIPGVPV